MHPTPPSTSSSSHNSRPQQGSHRPRSLSSVSASNTPRFTTSTGDHHHQQQPQHLRSASATVSASRSSSRSQSRSGSIVALSSTAPTRAASTVRVIAPPEEEQQQLSSTAVCRQGVSLEQFSCPLELEEEDAEALLIELGGDDDEDESPPADGGRRDSVTSWMKDTTTTSRGHSRTASNVGGYAPQPTFKRFDPGAPAVDYSHAVLPHVPLSPIKARPLLPTAPLEELEEEDEDQDFSSCSAAAAAAAAAILEVPEPSSDAMVAVKSRTFHHQASVDDNFEDLSSSSTQLFLSAPAAPNWPTFSPRLAATVEHSAGGAKTFSELFASVPDSVLSAAQNAMLSTGPKPKKKRQFHSPHKAGITIQELVSESDEEELEDDDDDAEEIMEMVETGPARSHTHAAATAPAVPMGARKQYYFEQKQLLDRDAGTLEGAAPAMVSAAVRARQSPFAPWCDFYEEQVVQYNGAFPAEIEKLLEAAHGAPSDGGNVTATPLSANKVWITCGVKYHPLNRELIIINPAVAVPEYVRRHLPDAALKLDSFKSVTIRGNPKFERGAQTTLTHYHEVKVFWDIAKVALLQREGLGRLGVLSGRSFWLVHLCSLERYNRRVMEWHVERMVAVPKNPLSLYYGQIRERKGQRRMLQELLDVPTADGQVVRQILAQDQREDFDRAIALSERLIVETEEFSLPLQQVVKMEHEVRQQEGRCYDAWVASMEHLLTLIGMSCARRSSVRVRRSLSTKTDLDGKISQVQAALRQAAESADGA